MLVIISYDVSTVTEGGKRRLRRVAKICVNHGIRVQNSVFECNLDLTELESLKTRLLRTIDLEHDSLRLYNLGNNWRNKTEHFGAKEGIDVESPMVL